MKDSQRFYLLCSVVFLLFGYVIWTRRLASLPKHFQPIDSTQDCQDLIQQKLKSQLPNHCIVSTHHNELDIKDTEPNKSGFLQEGQTPRLCRHQYHYETLRSDKFLVIGAISYPGYIVSKILKGKGHDMKVTEDISSLGFDLGTWKNYDMSKEAGISPSIVDFTSSEVKITHIGWLKEGGTIVYIPSLLFNAIHASSFFDLNFVTSILKTFTNILEAVKHKEKVKIVVFTPAGDLQSSQHATAIRMFSLLLSSYNYNYDTQISYLSFNVKQCNAPHNLLCCNTHELEEKIKSLLFNTSSLGCNEFPLQCSEQYSLSQSIHSGELRNVVTSTHFTSSRKFRKDSFEFMKGFYMTAMRQNFGILIFHDGLSDYFVEQLRRYKHSEIVRIKGLNGRSMNDARFYMLYDYLLKNSRVRSIVFQDIRDGMFPGDPFKLMDDMGDVVYVGVDKSFYVSAYDHPWMRNSKYRECNPNELRKDRAQYHPFYNAGTVGGTRDVMLTFLTRLIQYFDKSPHHYNCNMATVCVVTHNHFFEHSYSGYPFEGYTDSGIGISRGLAVRHKGTEYI